MEKEVIENLNNDLLKGLINPKFILSTFDLINDQSRKSSAYTDPRYVPFYYYLSKYIQPVNILEVGFYLGLLSGNFLRNCKSTKSFLAFQEKSDDFYSSRLGRKNIKRVYNKKFDFYYGNLIDVDFENKLNENKWDLVIFNFNKNYDECLRYLQMLWKYVSINGYIVLEYINYNKEMKKALESFCKIENRNFIIFDTRYGTAIVKK